MSDIPFGDASPASASASAPEVATACKRRGRPPAKKIALKLDEMTRLRRWEEMSSDLSQHQQVAFDVCGGQGGVLDLRAHDVQGVPQHEAVRQDERHARSGQ